MNNAQQPENERKLQADRVELFLKHIEEDFAAMLDEQQAAAGEIHALRKKVHTLRSYLWALVASRGGMVKVSDHILELALLENTSLEVRAEEGRTRFTCGHVVPEVEASPIVLPARRIITNGE